MNMFQKSRAQVEHNRKSHTLPFKLSDEMIIGLTYYTCKMINLFPNAKSAGGLASREIFTVIRTD